MKKYLILSILFLLPGTALAEGYIQVDNSVLNIQGTGKLSADDMEDAIQYGNNLQILSGKSHVYTIPSGTYEVTGTPVPGYEYTTAGNCKGSIRDNQVKACQLQWTDTGSQEEPHFTLSSDVTVPETQVKQETIEENPEFIRSLLLQIIDLLKQLISLKQSNGSN